MAEGVLSRLRPQQQALVLRALAMQEAQRMAQSRGQRGALASLAQRFGFPVAPGAQDRLSRLPQDMVAGAPVVGDIASGVGRWAQENPLDAGALAVSPVPVLGDLAGLANDMRHYATDPESRTWGNYALSMAGLLPLVPGVAGTLAKAANDLPMDEASRMARAQQMGFTTDAYHGTHAGDIRAFGEEFGDIGTHVGSQEQAANRLLDTRDPVIKSRSLGYREGANIMPLRANLGRTIELEDVGLWNDSDIVATALRKKGIDVSDILDDVADAKASFRNPEKWLKSEQNKSALAELRNKLIEAGYDSVTYRNVVENAYGDLSEMTDAAAKQQAALGRRIREIKAAASERMPPMPDANDPNLEEKIMAWASVKADDYLTKQEIDEINEATRRIRAISDNPSSRNNPNSYIILNPSNIRSRFARFDPRNADSADLLAGIAGAGVVGNALLADRDRRSNPGGT